MNTGYFSNFQYNMFYKPNVDFFFLESDKRLTPKYHMQIFDKGNFKDVQYEDQKTTFIDLKKNKDKYKPPKLPLPTGYLVPRLINKEFVPGELSILPIYI